MKTNFIIIIFVAVFGNAYAQPKYDTLYNSTIITLSKIGLPPATIINKIQTSVTSFDVSTNAIIKLSQDGVKGEVIDEMIKRDAQVNKREEKEVNSSNPNAMHKPGIYSYEPSDKEKPLKKIDPSVVSTNKSGSFGESVANHYSYGISKTTAKSYISGVNSSTQINTSTPTFYFYFKVDDNPAGDSWFFSTATSPKEFVLVWMYKEKDGRSLKTGSYNSYGGSTGIPEKDKVPFDISEISDGIYKVTFSTPLKAGEEYAFMYANAAPSRYSARGSKIFDFGIKK